MSKFNIRNEVQRLQRRGWKFARIGSILYHYSYQEGASRKGVYVPSELPLKKEIAEIMTDWDGTKRNWIIEYLLDTSTQLWEKPPLDEINLTNGILNLKTRELRKHDPEFLSPVQLNAAHNPLATGSQIQKFIDQVFPEDVGDLGYEIAGLLMVPNTAFQKAFLLYGKGANGKSVYLNVLESFVGITNTTRISLHSLAADRFAASELAGMLLNISADLPSNHISDTSMFKSIVGEDTIAVQKKYRDIFMLKPYSRLVFSANDLPPSSDSSDGFIRRWMIIPFPRIIPPEERDPKLLEKLTTPSARAGLLNKALNAYDGLMERGCFSSGKSTTDALAEFIGVNNPVLAFCSEYVYEGVGLEVSRGALYSRYVKDMESLGIKPVNAKKFADQIRGTYPQVEEVKIQGTRFWRGIGLEKLNPVRLYDL